MTEALGFSSEQEMQAYVLRAACDQANHRGQPDLRVSHTTDGSEHIYRFHIDPSHYPDGYTIDFETESDDPEASAVLSLVPGVKSARVVVSEKDWKIDQARMIGEDAAHDVEGTQSLLPPHNPSALPFPLQLAKALNDRLYFPAKTGS